MSKTIVELNNYHLFSTLGLDSVSFDRNKYDRIMDRHPNIITVDLGQPLNNIAEYTDDPHQVLNGLIKSYMVSNFKDEEVKYCVSEINGIAYIRQVVDKSWVVNNISLKDYEQMVSTIKEGFTNEACAAITYINNLFSEHQIPYFENILPYKHVLVEEKSTHAMFIKMTFEDLFKRIKGYNISQP